MREDPRSCRKCTTILQVTGKHGTTLVRYFWTLSGLLLVGCWLLRFGLGQTNRTLSNTTEPHATVGNSRKRCVFPTLRPCVLNCTVILDLRMSQMASLWCLHVNQWLSLLSLESAMKKPYPFSCIVSLFLTSTFISSICILCILLSLRSWQKIRICVCV